MAAAEVFDSISGGGTEGGSGRDPVKGQCGV
jgi:hypothetical protein